MFFRSACVFGFAMLAVAANGAECRLDQARYVEPVSGATMQFHPKTQDDATQSMAVFDLALPKVDDTFAGDITWNNGNNARPDATIKDLAFGNVYAIDKGTVGLIDDTEMAAPPSILVVDFGRALYGFMPLLQANPDARGFDLFTLTGCP